MAAWVAWVREPAWEEVAEEIKDPHQFFYNPELSWEDECRESNTEISEANDFQE